MGDYSAFLAGQIRGVEADRDAWKARAERAEAAVVEGISERGILHGLLGEVLAHDGVTHPNWRQDWMSRAIDALEGRARPMSDQALKEMAERCSACARVAGSLT